jgi:hypothetical protein
VAGLLVSAAPEGVGRSADTVFTSRFVAICLDHCLTPLPTDHVYDLHSRSIQRTKKTPHWCRFLTEKRSDDSVNNRHFQPHPGQNSGCFPNRISHRCTLASIAHTACFAPSDRPTRACVRRNAPVLPRSAPFSRRQRERRSLSRSFHCRKCPACGAGSPDPRSRSRLRCICTSANPGRARRGIPRRCPVWSWF